MRSTAAWYQCVSTIMVETQTKDCRDNEYLLSSYRCAASKCGLLLQVFTKNYAEQYRGPSPNLLVVFLAFTMRQVTAAAATMLVN
jgi:hypothetical protein